MRTSQKFDSPCHAQSRPASSIVMRLRFLMALVILLTWVRSAAQQVNTLTLLPEEFEIHRIVDLATGVNTIRIGFRNTQPSNLTAVSMQFAMDAQQLNGCVQDRGFTSSLMNAEGTLAWEHDETPQILVSFTCTDTTPVTPNDTFWMQWSWVTCDGTQGENSEVNITGIVQVDVIVGLRPNGLPNDPQEDGPETGIGELTDSQQFDRVVITTLTGQIVRDQNLNGQTWKSTLQGLQPGQYVLAGWRSHYCVCRRMVIIRD